MKFLLLFSKLMLSIGIPKEIKPYEKRVSMIPEDIIELINYYKSLNKDIQVFIQKSAGINGGYSDEDYLISPSVILCDTIEEVYNKSKIIIKVKEPQPYEFSLIRDEHTIMAFFHFAANKELETFFNSKKTKCIVYETIKDSNKNYPLLAPMSKIAGKQGLIVAHNYINDNDKKSAIISIIGFINIPIIKFSVEYWNSLHQKASIIRSKGIAIDPAMLKPLMIMSAMFFCYFIFLSLILVKNSLMLKKLNKKY